MATSARGKRAPATARAVAAPDERLRGDPLGRSAHFRLLPAAERRRLLGHGAERVLREGEVLFAEGEPCRGLYLLVEGQVELRQISPRGRAQVLHSEGPGATLGEAPLFDRGGYVASAVATAPTRALFVPRAAIVALFRRYPEVALSLLETLARRARHFADLAGRLTFRPVHERLAHYIVRAAGWPGHRVPAGLTVDLGLTQEQLAAHVGTVRELVARALSQLERSGVIARDRSRITIRDPVRLARLARGAEGPTGVM
jgi:CRP/FNR family cyclic AMP-dependent transcriptional regulator